MNRTKAKMYTPLVKSNQNKRFRYKTKICSEEINQKASLQE